MTEEFAAKAQAHTRYYCADGERVPGVTTILNVLNKPALVPWANKLGLQGIDTRKYVDAAALVGTLAHEMVEYYLRGERLDLRGYSPDDVQRARKAFRKFVMWAKAHKIESLLLEEPLVAEGYRFGGTIDWYGLRDGVPALIDFKTSKALYPEHLLQVAAYRRLLIENGYQVEAAYILRIGRDESEGFEERIVENLDKRWELFEHCLEIYRLMQELK